MESVGAISESEWSYFSAMYSSEESDLKVQLLNNCSTNEFHDASSFGYPSFLPEHEESMIMTNVDIGSLHPLDNVYTNANCHSLGSTISYEDGSSFIYGGHYVSDCDHVLWINHDSVFDNCTEEAKVTYSNGHVNLKNQEDTNNTDIHKNSLYIRSGAQLTEPSKKVKLKNPKRKSKKRCGNSSDVEKSKRNVQSKKKQKLNTISTNEEERISAIPMENSSSCYSEDEPNTLNQLTGGGILISDLKADVAADKSGTKRSNNGSATDPQSLYARKRREKINERLRILQNLVPNGTKVDISTMLEEAVQYVKFLQLQIKLLSSDELWMYAPIAYNGMNLGFDMKINVPKGR